MSTQSISLLRTRRWPFGPTLVDELAPCTGTSMLRNAWFGCTGASPAATISSALPGDMPEAKAVRITAGKEPTASSR